MTTGGGLVFTGGTNDRMFRAFEAATGKVLWEYLNRASPGNFPEVPEGGVVWVFSLAGSE